MDPQQTLPRLGCGAAIVRDGRILLVRRRRMPEADHWGLPGGKVDPFETVPAAVVREVQEELGIAIELGSLLCVVDQIDRQREEHWVAPVYLVERFEGDPAVREPEALSGCDWFPLDGLPGMLTVATRQALAALRRPRNVGSRPG